MEGRTLSVLSYDVGSSGWTDELTGFHEDTAGPNHPMDRASREHALGQLRRHVVNPAPVILEVGCSSGYMLRDMRQRLPSAFVMGADYVRGPLVKLAAEMPDLPLLQFDLVKCPLPSETCDAVVLLNVLEHVEKDAEALRQVHRILRPGGICVIEVPAGPNLYDVYDKMLMHHRRYTLGGAVALASEAGFQVVDRSHLGFFVYPAFWLAKKRNQRLRIEDEATQQRIVAKNIDSTEQSRLLRAVMRLELLVGGRIAYPFGIRCLLTCKKPS